MTDTVTAEMLAEARREAHDAAVAESRALGDRSMSRDEKAVLRRTADVTWRRYQRLLRQHDRQQG